MIPSTKITVFALQCGLRDRTKRIKEYIESHLQIFDAYIQDVWYNNLKHVTFILE